MAFSFTLNITIMNILELDSYNLADAVKFNDRLNPRLWGKDERMLPQVRDHLMKIADDFREFLGVSGYELKDITVSGSNAAYTYTPNSDVDLHLIVDLPQADASEVYRELFDAKKFQYNEQHNISIGSYPVELYVQDANKRHISQGIYSVMNNEWIDVPKRRDAGVDDVSTRSKYEDLVRRIDDAVKSGDKDTTAALMTTIKNMRQAGLDQHGEFGPENIAFKMLRNQGYIKQLVDARNNAKDAELSLKERTVEVNKPFKYGFKTIENATESADGVSDSTRMVINEKPVPSVSEVVSLFVDFCVAKLNIKQRPVIKFKRDPEWSARNKTFGRYSADTNLLEVSLSNRHVMDILRTVAHELTHKKQYEIAELPDNAGETGSKWENEANAKAGVLMREYAQMHPEFFEADQIAESSIGDMRNYFSKVDPARPVVPNTINSKMPREIVDILTRINNSQIVSKEDYYKLLAFRKAELDAAKKPAIAAESSGYIPTKKQAKDPRFAMALTKDIRPGQTGKEANKLGLQTDSQGAPALLMNQLANELREFKNGKTTAATTVKESVESLFEINMSPSSLRSQAAKIGAMAGMEFEMIVPGMNTEDDNEDDPQPDYDQDESVSSIDDALRFFRNGDYVSPSDINMLQDNMQEVFQEWARDQLDSDWQSEGKDALREYLINNELDLDDIRSDADQEIRDENSELDAGSKEFIDLYNSRVKDKINDAVNEEWSDQGRNYSNAQEEFEDEKRDDYGESDWLDNDNLEYMTDVQRRFDIAWPHMIDQSSSGGTSIAEIGEEFSSMIGRPVNASSRYHGGKRTIDGYVVEPDGSLEGEEAGDVGLEFISPPLPIDQMISDLNKVKDWANNAGAYTNDSTGLHINVSIPEYDAANLDYVKLALMMGDQYVLDLFGRTGNSYAESALAIVKKRVAERPEDAAALLDKMRGNLKSIATRAVHSGITKKFTSINNKSGYIEFRSPGGDWLGDNFEKIENTLLRFVVALDSALNPEKDREEYLTKLYKLLAPAGSKNTIAYFAQYVAGKIPQAALKSFVRQAQLERKSVKDAYKELQPAATKQYVVTDRSGYTVLFTATSPMDAMGQAEAQYPTRFTDVVSSVLYTPRGQTSSTPVPGSTIDLQQQRAAAARAAQQPAPTTWTGQWLIRDSETDAVLHQFGGVGNSQADANRRAAQWATDNNRGGGIEVVPEMT